MEFNKDTLDLRQKEEKIRTFARNNPILDMSFYRKSVLPYLGEMISNRELSIAQSLETVEQSLEDMRSGLNIYSAYLPKQARWQAEFLVTQSLAEMQIDTVVRDFSSIANAVERLTSILEKKIFYEIDQQRLESFKFIEHQRNLVFLELERERRVIFEDLKNLIREEIHQERVEAFKDLEPLLNRILDQSMEKVESPIDHFFIRLMEYTILIGIIIIVLFLLRRRIFPQNKS